MAHLLRVICVACGTSYVSAHQADRVSVEAGEDVALHEQCPHCGHVDAYHPVDYQAGSLVGKIEPVVPARD